jgi:hypothetical protein
MEWLSLMQHHGAPTRLLDFTYSIYIAVYFAVENATQDSAVWAMNFDWAMERSLDVLKLAKWSTADLAKLKSRFTERSEADVASHFLNTPNAKVVCPINPFRLNERLRVQKGLFLVPRDIEVSFMENLASMRGHDEEKNLFRLVIPAECARKARRRVFDMNITRRSLFPGLDGYSQALGVYHPVFRSHKPGRK